MQLLKFNVFLLLICLSGSLQSFESRECLEASFSATVSHKSWPMGLSQNILEVTKKKCDIYIEHERLKYIKQKWHIDVCREPVHVKKGRTVQVLKKSKKCTQKSDDAFCLELMKIEDVIQDDGLIFADGDKKNLESTHGQVYCAYQLLKSYTRFDNILSVGKSFSFESMREAKLNKSSSTIGAPPRPVIEGEREDENRGDISEELTTKEAEDERQESSSTRSF